MKTLLRHRVAVEVGHHLVEESFFAESSVTKLCGLVGPRFEFLEDDITEGIEDLSFLHEVLHLMKRNEGGVLRRIRVDPRGLLIEFSSHKSVCFCGPTVDGESSPVERQDIG